MDFSCPPTVEKTKGQGKWHMSEHVRTPPASCSLQRWHMQTQRVAMFKSFNHTTAQGPMWHCTLHHWKPVLLMLSRVKYSSVVGNALCCWFKVGWSRNNGHEKNMARPCEWQPTSITSAGAVPKMVQESGYVWENIHTRIHNISPRRLFSPWYQSQREWLDSA